MDAQPPSRTALRIARASAPRRVLAHERARPGAGRRTRERRVVLHRQHDDRQVCGEHLEPRDEEGERRLASLVVREDDRDRVPILRRRHPASVTCTRRAQVKTISPPAAIS